MMCHMYFYDDTNDYTLPVDGAGTRNQEGRPCGISAPTLGRFRLSSSSLECGIGNPPPPLDPSPLAATYGTPLFCIVLDRAFIFMNKSARIKYVVVVVVLIVGLSIINLLGKENNKPHSYSINFFAVFDVRNA